MNIQNFPTFEAVLASAGVSACGILLQILFALLAIMLIMTFAGLSVVAERKVCAYIQGRYGPNRTAIPLVAAIPLIGNFLKKNGLMQLAADGLKFLFKEDPIPAHVRKFWYIAAPVMALAPVLVVAGLIPFGVWHRFEPARRARRQLARGVRLVHGGVVVEQQVPVFGRNARLRAGDKL